MTTRPEGQRPSRFAFLRARLSFANLTALLALFVALGGTSYAALQLPKNSVGAKQIKQNSITSPKVKQGSLLTSDFNAAQRASLRGPQGQQGPTGDRGDRGERGDQGPAGPFPGGLPSGSTVRGAYSAAGTGTANTLVTDSISFGFVLASAPTPHFIPSAGPTNSACPGTVASPTANAGHLCIYEGVRTNVGGAFFGDPVTGATGSTVRPWGAEVGAFSTVAGDVVDEGSWAVTAP